MKTILILMDTLNRHMLKTYNENGEAITPNIDRLAKKSVVFENHFIGSAPCMPARRDILTGRVNFLERGWGPIEPMDVTFPRILRQNGIFSHIVTDHCHYAELGGEGYMQCYNTWDMIRGQETDVWASSVKEPTYPEHYIGRVGREYQCNRSRFETDADYPTPKTFAAATKWLQENRGADNFFLQVESFDPHEPFDATEEFKAMYPDDFETFYEWPRYDNLGKDETPEALEHLRHMYYATLSMADKWLGKLLDEMDAQNLWEDTMVIFTSDHGHMLGEHNATGKNRFHAWNEMSNIPLFVHLPGDAYAGERVRALTQNIDIMPTVLDFFGIKTDLSKVHGKSWMPLFEGAKSIREYAIYGWFGKPVNITDGRYTYFRAPASRDNTPLYQYYQMPVTFQGYLGKNLADEEKKYLTAGKYLSWTDELVYRLDQGTLTLGKPKDMAEEAYETRLFDLITDPQQNHPLQDSEVEDRMKQALIQTMKEHDTPLEQLERLGLSFIEIGKESK
ncbi:MAG: sulfatase [Acetatifactor sp.]|nr:sulfatase [Acetatifactor sp.]